MSEIEKFVRENPGSQIKGPMFNTHLTLALTVSSKESSVSSVQYSKYTVVELFKNSCKTN